MVSNFAEPACPSTRRKREGARNPRSRDEVPEIAKGTRNSSAIVESYRCDGSNGVGNATMILLNYRIPCESSAALPAINHPGKERLCLRRRDRFPGRSAPSGGKNSRICFRYGARWVGGFVCREDLFMRTGGVKLCDPNCDIRDTFGVLSRLSRSRTN